MTDDLKLEMDAYQPLRNVVFQTLRTAILKGELKPGERLMELQLAAKLGVSRTPIREAIRMLEQEGLAKTVPRKGAHVAKMTEKEMEDVLQVRQALEELAARTSCERFTRAQLQELQQAQHTFEQSTARGNVKEIAQADVEFHDVIYRGADNPRLTMMLNNLREQMYRYRVEYLKDSSCYPQLVREHQEMVQAFSARDREAVITILRQHLKNQTEVVKQMIREQNESDD